MDSQLKEFLETLLPLLLFAAIFFAYYRTSKRHAVKVEKALEESSENVELQKQILMELREIRRIIDK